MLIIFLLEHIKPAKEVESNNYLANPEILLKGKIQGPEHILEKNGKMYTSLSNGQVVEIDGDKIEVLNQFGKYCSEGETYTHCGRPLGLAFDTLKEDTLIVMDSSTGIFELNIKTKKIKYIVLSNDFIGKENPRQSKLFNSVTVAKNGDLYYTESTSDVEIDKVFLSFLLNPCGRLVHVERKTKKATVLIDRLFFANGIVLSPDEDFLILSELGSGRILRYYLTEKKAGLIDTFIDELPGTPDNLSADKNGIWVALPMTTTPLKMMFFQNLAPYPTIRKFFARTIHLADSFFMNAYKYSSLGFFKTLSLKVNSFTTYPFLFPNRASILRLDWDGKIVAAYHADDGSFYTHVMEKDGKLYLGSFVHDYIAVVDRQKHNIVKPKALTGALEVNNHLDHAERLFEGEIQGPEYLLAASGDSYYASLHNGNVVRIDGGKHITFIAKFGKPCDYPVEESICGRPLGLAYDTINPDQLIVADAYYGIWELNVKTGQKKNLVSPTKTFGSDNPRPGKIFNSVAVAKNGDIYFSHSSSDFDIDNGAYSFFANPSGRLVHFDRKTEKLTVLLDNLWFANGVVLSPNEDFVVVAETHASRAQKYWLKGEKKGQSEAFVEGLPGIPDNLIGDEDGVWIALVVSADPENPMIPQSTARLPYVRKFLIRVLHLIEMPFNFISKIYPNPYTPKIVYHIGSFSSLSFVFPERKTIVRTDWNGKIIGSLHGWDKTLGTISHVMELGDFLYLGSPYADYIGRVWFVNKDQIHPRQKQKREVPKTTEAPTTTTQKPTTTTQKPTTTTQKPTTTTQKPTTTTQKPTTTTEKPVVKETPTTTQKPVTTTKAPSTATPEKKAKDSKNAKEKDRKAPEEIPIHESVKDDTPPPQKKEPLKVIKKDGPTSI
ncbi:hypothetical protein PVAND_008769 [Polypedilum vanderplanki]|uniref:Strictosidine synthase conserved region domain-containing protein n=1 Tax=Polypedilum vanderplanki TaxID=319348 RepID=A0A9J6CAN9_POLVA|nr:hypothetical protein PVAND_008769 [Polypedilum vanderplanki]